MKFLLLRLLPKNLASRLAGQLADLRLPIPILTALIKIYTQFYRVDLAEMKKPLAALKTFNEFFTRELKPGIRPIDPDPDSVVSPVDGTVAEFGAIAQGLLVQTKGVLYALSDLVGSAEAARLADGYYLTLYLSPSDYHRIHAPIAGTVKRFSYFSGQLWPVNALGVERVGGLFALNERLVTPLETDRGTVVVVKVGATIVGRITLDYSSLRSTARKQSQLDLPVNPARTYGKGAEIGQFQLGSTVLLLFEKGRFEPHQLHAQKRVRVGEVLGYLVSGGGRQTESVSDQKT